MPLDLATLNRHLDKPLGDLPVTGTIDGAPFIGTRGPLTEDQRLMNGGLEEKLANNLYIKATTLTNPIPGIGLPVAIDGDPIKYKIGDVWTSADNGQLVRYALAFAREI